MLSSHPISQSTKEWNKSNNLQIQAFTVTQLKIVKNTGIHATNNMLNVLLHLPVVYSHLDFSTYHPRILAV